MLISSRAKAVSNKISAALTGFSAGLLIALVCFEMLPEVFVRQGIYVGIAGIVLGTALSAYSEAKTSGGGMTPNFGEMFHRLTEGMALGYILSRNSAAGFIMAAVIALHSLALAASVRRRPFLLGLPVALGALIGSGLIFLPGHFSALCLAFAGGVMIYASCGEILPEAREPWRGRLTAAAAAVGFMCGIFFTTAV